MPAPVQPGYTRGPLLFIDTRGDALVDRSLYQWFWREAGGYGARILLLAAEPEQQTALDELAELCTAWEAEQVTRLLVDDRAMTANSTHTAAAVYATAIAILGEDPARLAATLGGSVLATALRRANARSKVVAGIGGASAFLCQHVLRPGPAGAATVRDAVGFWPGLGLLNRVTIDTLATSAEPPTRLLAAVATNPFLVGVGLAPGSAAVVHQDNTVQSLGSAAVTVVDGGSVTAIDLDAPITASHAVVGAMVHMLAMGDGFNLDTRAFRPAGDIDLPPTGPVTSAF
jgi:cyanophycinase